jgi:hypothetical protein
VLIGGTAGLLASVLFVTMGRLAWSQPQDETDAAGMLAMSLFALAALAFVAGVTSVAFALWRRGHAPRHSETPMWRGDPWREAQWRYWNGRTWTDFTA